MKKVVLIPLLFALSAGAAEIAVEGINCPEGFFSGNKGGKNQQECIPYDKEAAERATYPKDSKEECLSKECLEKQDKFIKTKIEN